MLCFAKDTKSEETVSVTFNARIDSVTGAPPAEDTATYIAPGWIDLQVNGYAGVDYNSPHTPHEEIARSIQVQYAAGVTRLYPTVITGSEANIVGSLRNLAQAKEKLAEGEAMEGFHVEGPHISPEDGPRGAHPREAVRPPDIEEYKRWQEAAQGHVRLVTVSPEWPQAPGYIEALVKDGVLVSIGHTKATGAQIEDAVRAGATMSTHLGNGAHAVLPRHPNYIWEQLAEDRLAASFIVDGVHLPPSFVKVALRAKGLERSVLVTDAVMPAGCRPGPYRLGEVDVELLPPGDRVVLRGQDRLAGSALSMDLGVANLMRFGGLSLADAVRLATVNPARVASIEGRQRGLEAGERADLVLFRLDPVTRAITVLETFLSGRSVYRASA